MIIIKIKTIAIVIIIYTVQLTSDYNQVNFKAEYCVIFIH